MTSFNQKNRKFKERLRGRLAPEAKLEITTGQWLKEQEKVGWGEGREAMAAKNRSMEKLGSLRGRRVGYQYDMRKKKGTSATSPRV